MQRLRKTSKFVAHERQVVPETFDRVNEHWTARLSVHVGDRLELSRSKMETLRHLLSYVYDKEADAYKPIRIWENPNDPNDFSVMASLSSRLAGEK
eukprot:1387473-Pleurochrysis_carterae.AAC.1